MKIQEGFFLWDFHQSGVPEGFFTSLYFALFSFSLFLSPLHSCSLSLLSFLLSLLLNTMEYLLNKVEKLQRWYWVPRMLLLLVSPIVNTLYCLVAHLPVET